MTIRTARVAPEKADFRPALPLRSFAGFDRTNVIQAIETEYAGHLFRSRLEARWAVFFDALCLRWEYEQQGYEDDNGARYLPDFRLPDLGMWAEVKGTDEAMQADAARLQSVLRPGGPLPLIVLGPIASIASAKIIHPVLLWDDERGLSRRPGLFIPLTGGGADFAAAPHPLTSNGLYFMAAIGLAAHFYVSMQAPPAIPREWTVQSMVFDDHGFPRIDAAYKAARQARFEHGQAGAR